MLIFYIQFETWSLIELVRPLASFLPSRLRSESSLLFLRQTRASEAPSQTEVWFCIPTLQFPYTAQTSCNMHSSADHHERVRV